MLSECFGIVVWSDDILKSTNSLGIRSSTRHELDSETADDVMKMR